MKQSDLKVGTKGGPILKVPFTQAESLAEAVALCKGNETVAVHMFNRGWRIAAQGESGARDAVRDGASVQEVTAILTAWDPTVKKARAPRGPRTVTIEAKAGQKLTFEQFQELLAKQGIVVKTAEAAAPTA